MHNIFLPEEPTAGKGSPAGMTFRCQCCGDCCSTMGEIISIRRQISPFDFEIGYTNGELRMVSVDPDKRELFGFIPHEAQRSLACPFLRQRGPRERICTVHATRPEICRNYLCARILVLDRDKRRAGRVLPKTRCFTTGEKALLDLWNLNLQDITVADDEQWEKYIEEIFTRAGYLVVR